MLRAGVLSQTNAKYLRVHELVIHTYAAESDDKMFDNTYLQRQGLLRPDGTGASSYITGWISTDCKCTPGVSSTSCQANTAKW